MIYLSITLSAIIFYLLYKLKDTNEWLLKSYDLNKELVENNRLFVNEIYRNYQIIQNLENQNFLRQQIAESLHKQEFEKIIELTKNLVETEKMLCQ